MHWQLTPYILLPLASAAIVAVLSLYAWQRHRVAGATPFAAAGLAVTVWSVSNALEAVGADLSTKLFWDNVQYLSYAAMPVTWLALVLQYTGHGRWLTRYHLVVLSLVPLATVALVWTGDPHGIVRAGIRLEPGDRFPVLDKSYGPWFWVFGLYNYALLSASGVLLVQMLLSVPRRYRGQTLALLIALVIPLVGSALHILGLGPIRDFDVTPLLTGLSCAAAAWGLFRYRLFDLVPVARDRVIEGMGDGVVVLDSRGQVADLNPAAEDLLGLPNARVLGQLAAEAFAEWPALVAACSGSPGDRTELGVNGGHTFRYYEVRSSPLAGSRGQALGRVVVLRDVTERKRTERALQEANQRLGLTVGRLEQRNQESSLLNEMGGHLQICLIPEEVYAVVEQTAPLLFPGDGGALLLLGDSGLPAQAVAAWGDLPPEERSFAPEECWALRSRRVHMVEQPGARPSCRKLSRSAPADYLCVPMVVQGDALGVLHLRSAPPAAHPPNEFNGEGRESRRQLAVAVAERVGLALANLRLRQSLREQAIRDPLTGLFNRRYLEETLDREMDRAARRESTVGVVMLDLDHFKRVNDLLGHEAGDALLRAVGGYLQGHTRGEDIACRYGGDEIVLILPEASLETTMRRAEQLREGIKRLRVGHGGRLLEPATTSAGVAGFPEHGATGEAVLRSADSALYRAKAGGRDRTEIATRDSSAV